MNEEWKDIPGFGGHYEASSLGRIRSKPREVTRPHSRTGKPVVSHYKQRLLSIKKLGPSGHRCVTLTSDGVESCVFVHTLVLLAFVGPRPAGMEACHNNGNCLDNRPSNLRWDTHLANNRDRLKHGTYQRGSKHPMAKLHEDDVASIRARKLKPADAAREFGICVSHAHRIVKGEVWRS
jgi:hypothetical protein